MPDQKVPVGPASSQERAGFIGVRVDPTPAEVYTVEGQVGGTATAPEGIAANG